MGAAVNTSPQTNLCSIDLSKGGGAYAQAIVAAYMGQIVGSLQKLLNELNEQKAQFIQASGTAMAASGTATEVAGTTALIESTVSGSVNIGSGMQMTKESGEIAKISKASDAEIGKVNGELEGLNMSDKALDERSGRLAADAPDLEASRNTIAADKAENQRNREVLTRKRKTLSDEKSDKTHASRSKIETLNSFSQGITGISGGVGRGAERNADAQSTLARAMSQIADSGSSTAQSAQQTTEQTIQQALSTASGVYSASRAAAGA